MSQIGTTPPYWPKALAHLSAAHPVMQELIQTYEGEILSSRGDAFFTLVKSITGQQISVTAAQSIFSRLTTRIPDLSPESFLAVSEADVRECGYSLQKTRYLRQLARSLQSGDLSLTHLARCSDEEAVRYLSGFLGVGRWTAEMFLIFHSLRPDILPIYDIGLQKAVSKHLGENRRLFLEEVRTLCEPFRPYRTVATWYLWRSLDPVPVAY